MKFRVDVRVLKGTAAILAAVLVLLAGMLLLQRWENTQDAPVSSLGPSSAVEADAPVDGREITYYNGNEKEKKEERDAENEQEAAGGMGLLSQPPKPDHLQRPVPQLPA